MCVCTRCTLNTCWRQMKKKIFLSHISNYCCVHTSFRYCKILALINCTANAATLITLLTHYINYISSDATAALCVRAQINMHHNNSFIRTFSGLSMFCQDNTRVECHVAVKFHDSKRLPLPMPIQRCQCKTI